MTTKNSLPSLQLTSFPLCPFVQRSVITLKSKSVPFERKDIDLENPPKWFEEISPLGKVPVLVVDGKTALFESAVINEYVDEITEATTGKRFSPRDPLQKALERAWIEFTSELLGTQYQMYTTDNEEEAHDAMSEIFEGLARVGKVVKGPYFRGEEFSLVDAAIAPLFMRLELSEEIWSDARWKEIPGVRKWAERLLALPAVKESVYPDFRESFRDYCKEAGSPLF